MKLNGALKPRQGASTQGRSPGVSKEYRVKRYFQVNKNVVNSLPLNARGARNKQKFDNNNVVNSNYNSIYNQERAITSHSNQLERKGKCGEALLRGVCKSLSGSNSYTLIRVIKQIDLSTHDNTTQSRVSALTKAQSCPYLNNRRRKLKFLQKVSKSKAEMEMESKAAAAEIDTRKEKNIKRKANVQIYSETLAANNIAARQIGTQQRPNIDNKNNCIAENGRAIKQVNSEAFERQIHRPKQHWNCLGAKNINTNLKEITLRLAVELKLTLFSVFLQAIKYFSKKHFTRSAGGNKKAPNICSRANWCSGVGSPRLPDYNLTKITRTPQIIMNFLRGIFLKNAKGSESSVALFMVIYAVTAILLPHAVVGDDSDTFFPTNGIETTTPEFDYASRGQKKFGDKCENTLECGFPGSICDPKKKSCQCTEDLPVTNHIDKCGKEAAVNESCFFNEQCEVKYFQTECRDQRCVCRFDMTPIWLKDGSVECKGRGDKKGPETYIDPAMIGVLIGMALMFIIICVVLRLFSQARWRENRTIFNTPNPRLMNVSLLRESKLLHGQERRGSRMSVRAPSRQPSMASLRPHSPNPSLGKTGSRSNSHGSNASATSIRSTRSNCVSPAAITAGNNGHHERKGSTYQPHQHHHSQQHKLHTLQQEEEANSAQTNIISNPVAETVTVEIIEPEKYTKSSE